MNNIFSTEHINNNQVYFYFDSILKKTSELTNSSPKLQNELFYWANVMFQKYKIQFYSVMKLTYTLTQDPKGKYEYFDIVSINNIIRCCYETYLLFNYIYFPSSNLDEIKLKFLFYKYNGYKDASDVTLKNSDKHNAALKEMDNIKKEIYQNSEFKKLTKKAKNDLFLSWKPSWNIISKNTILSNWNSKMQYNILCQYSHNSFSSLTTINYHYTNLDKYDFDAINCQLYEVTTLFIESILLFFDLTLDAFSTDEVNLMSEFKSMATRDLDFFSNK